MQLAICHAMLQIKFDCIRLNQECQYNDYLLLVNKRISFSLNVSISIQLLYYQNTFFIKLSLIHTGQDNNKER